MASSTARCSSQLVRVSGNAVRWSGSRTGATGAAPCSKRVHVATLPAGKFSSRQLQQPTVLPARQGTAGALGHRVPVAWPNQRCHGVAIMQRYDSARKAPSEIGGIGTPRYIHSRPLARTARTALADAFDTPSRVKPTSTSAHFGWTTLNSPNELRALAHVSVSHRRTYYGPIELLQVQTHALSLQPHTHTHTHTHTLSLSLIYSFIHSFIHTYMNTYICTDDAMERAILRITRA